MSNVSVNNPTIEAFGSSEELFKTNDLISVLQKRGLIPDEMITDDKLQKVKQMKVQREYRNTKLLLESYRTIALAVKYLPHQIASELNVPFKSIDDLVEKCDIASAYDDSNIDDKLRNIQRTKQLIDVVHRSLTAVKNSNEDGKLYYKILYWTYISPKKVKYDEIVKRLNISLRGYYRKRDEAIKLLGSILWLAPDREVDLWIDCITLLNG
ncbi:MAG: hypothetical protein J1F23_07830 [Oscillospiraceae bacterium]|nr:hypothetical protein [Oscillospiraceae bacterium]